METEAECFFQSNNSNVLAVFKLPLFTNRNDIQICRGHGHKQLSRRFMGAYMCTALVKKQVVWLDDLVAQVCVFTPEILVQVVCLRLQGEITRLRIRFHLLAMPEISEFLPKQSGECLSVTLATWICCDGSKGQDRVWHCEGSLEAACFKNKVIFFGGSWHLPALTGGWCTRRRCCLIQGDNIFYPEWGTQSCACRNFYHTLKDWSCTGFDSSCFNHRFKQFITGGGLFYQ